MIRFEHVDGNEKGDIRLFALSTCVWCKRTKQLLSKLNVGYDYIFVDQLEGEKKEEVMKELERLNPRCSFPTLVINNTCIVGFKKEKIREALSDG